MKILGYILSVGGGLVLLFWMFAWGARGFPIKPDRLAYACSEGESAQSCHDNSVVSQRFDIAVEAVLVIGVGYYLVRRSQQARAIYMKTLGYIFGVVAGLVLIMWLVSWALTGFTTRTRPIALSCIDGPGLAACLNRNREMPPVGVPVIAFVVSGASLYLVKRDGKILL